MISKEEIEKAKETMKHWVEYEKQNKDKINKADELIEIQETLLQYINQLEQENSKLNKMIDEMAKAYMKVTSEKYRIKNICEKGKCQNEECHEDDWIECIKQHFKKEVEE